MATTERSFNTQEIDLGLNDNSYPLKGVRQMAMDLSQVAAVLQEASDLGADDVGLYAVGGSIDPRYVLAGWLNDQVVKSLPATDISLDMAHELIQAIRDIHDQERQKNAALLTTPV